VGLRPWVGYPLYEAQKGLSLWCSRTLIFFEKFENRLGAERISIEI
jgi:hypothetical protein